MHVNVIYLVAEVADAGACQRKALPRAVGAARPPGFFGAGPLGAVNALLLAGSGLVLPRHAVVAHRLVGFWRHFPDAAVGA